MEAASWIRTAGTVDEQHGPSRSLNRRRAHTIWRGFLMFDPQERSAGALARALARKIGRELEERGTGRETEVSDADGALATEALDRSIELALSCAARVREERDAAPALLAELLALPALDRETAVVVNARYQSYTLAS